MIKYSFPTHLSPLIYRALFFKRASLSPTLPFSLCCLESSPLRELTLSVVQVIYNLAGLSCGVVTLEHFVLFQVTLKPGVGLLSAADLIFDHCSLKCSQGGVYN